MTNQEKFFLGIAAGAAAVVAASRVVRGRHAIDFGGRTVAITGGSRGLGLVIARQFADRGARVCLLARNEEELRRAKEQLVRLGAEDVMTILCDVRDAESIRGAVSRIVEERGAVDILVNNAGIIEVGPLDHMSTEDFENAMATHFWGPLHLMRACLPGMRRRGFGRIVNISSIGGRIAVPHLAPYCASKFALSGLSDAMRAELAHEGIRITTVAPGLMRTGSPMNAAVKGNHRAEFAWFAISDSLPGLSVSAERAAQAILEACKYGDPDLTIGTTAKAAIIANALAPAVVAGAMAIAARILPGPAGPEGDRAVPGHEARSPWAPSILTALSDRAAVRNNELG
jgi:NAD(P)-dependent dehydrogenase (short-subunit alcohol dehydrogenase family)